MQALLLAAGMGKRLHTEKNKCMIEVQGISLWERMVRALTEADIKKIVVVTGYHAKELQEYILQHSEGLEVYFAENKEYETTNNIWSLYLAHDYFDEDTILLESDLIYEEHSIKQLCEYEKKNVAVLAKYESWMDGTTVCLEEGSISKIIPKKEMAQYNIGNLYKTVNIYKFSKEFLKDRYMPALEAFIDKNGKNEYYEMVLKEMVEKEKDILFGYELKFKWYEIDTIEDLKAAEKMFY